MFLASSLHDVNAITVCAKRAGHLSHNLDSTVSDDT